VATEAIVLATFIPASPERVYRAWLDAEEHSRFTGSPATSDPYVGGRFTAWDGYIQGTYRLLAQDRRIQQSWRTTDFPKGSPDSELDVHFHPEKRGTNLTLVHSEIPANQGHDYGKGWISYYFEPLKRYFAERPARRGARKAAGSKRKPARSASPKLGARRASRRR